MILISNGAFKSGSTWLFNILKELTKYPPPPAEYLNPDWVNPSIHPGKLKQFLTDFQKEGYSFLVKNHFASISERELILKNPNVYVFDITRDPKDVIVSAYHHRVKHGEFEGDFKDYYWKRGRYDLQSIRIYHEIWNIEHPNIFISDFEGLKRNFNQEIGKLCQFLNLTISEKDIRELAEITSIGSLRKKYKDDKEQPFFRKGTIGDWKNYLDRKIENDIERINQSGKIPNVKPDIFTRIKRKFKRIF